MNDDLIAFLRARYDEDEAVARAAADFGGGIHGFRWTVSGDHADDGGTYWRITAIAEASGHEQVIEVVGPGLSGGGAHTEQVAGHIARHDPARILAEVEAKRRFLARYEEVTAAGAASGTYSDVQEEYDWLLNLMWGPYADHPEFDEEWRP